jgi:hypothetical protein
MEVGLKIDEKEFRNPTPNPSPDGEGDTIALRCCIPLTIANDIVQDKPGQGQKDTIALRCCIPLTIANDIVQDKPGQGQKDTISEAEWNPPPHRGRG